MNRTKKQAVDICIITTIHPPFDARIYERGLKSLIDSGFSVCLISPWQKPENPWAKHQWISLPFSKRRIDRILHGFKTFRAASKQPAKVYYFHDIDFILWAVFLKLLKSVSVVYDCHENFPQEVAYHKEWIPNLFRKLLSRLTHQIENWAVKKLGFCVVAVPSQIKRFSKLGVRLVLVRNITNLRIRRDFKHKKALICTGSLSSSLQINLLINIAREIKNRKIDLPLVIADRFSSHKLKIYLTDTVEKEKLSITIHPSVMPKDIDKLLSEACIGITVEQNTPSKRLAIPTKVFEYMAMGLPIIASDLPETRKILNQANCGILVSPDQPEEYVDAAVHLIENPSEYNIFQQNGFRAIQSTYNWNKEKNKLVQFFNDLIRNNKNTADRN